MWFITVILANLLGRPARSLLTLSGIAIAVAAVVALLGVVRGFEASLLQLYQGRGIDVIVQQAGRLQMTASVLPEQTAEELAEVDGVAALWPVLIEVVSLLDDDMLGVVVQGWPPQSEPLQRLELVRGTSLSDPQGRQVLVGARLAAALGVDIGDTTELIEGEPLEVVGIFDSANVFDNGSMFAPLQKLQELMFRQGEVTFFAVAAEDHDPESLQHLAERLSGAGNQLQAEVAEEVARRSTEIRVARSFAWLTSVIAVLIGSVGMLNTMMMAVFERTREIAMLRALGWRRRRVIAMVLGESTLLCVTGAVIGIAAAVGMVRLLTAVPAAGRLVAGEVAPAVMLQGFCLALLLGVLGGIYPAWAAARLAPVEGLAMIDPPLLEAAGVSRFFADGNVTALHEVSLQVQRGEYVALVGKSGSGKSTLLNLLGTLDHPTAGTVRFGGQDLAQHRDLARFRSSQLGFVFQSFHLVPVLTAEQNIQLPMFETTLTAKQRRQKARELLERVGISHRSRHRPPTLSVGERQRVAIARALANSPSLLLADEPTGNLDSVTAEAIFELFDDLHRGGMTLLLVTHDPLLAQRAQRTLTLRDGRLVTD